MFPEKYNKNNNPGNAIKAEVFVTNNKLQTDYLPSVIDYYCTSDNFEINKKANQ